MKKEIVGRKEFISFPKLGIFKAICKIDTGAYTSSLHCNYINILEDEVEFAPNGEKIILPLYRQKYVKSSNGEKELRALIKTEALFLNKSYDIVLSLTNRSSMRNSILIGRKFLDKRFLVDVSKIYTQKG